MPIVQQLKELQGKINVLGSYSGNWRPQLSLDATQNLYLCAAWRGPGGRGGYSRSYFIWCQHFSFYPGVWFGDTRGWIWHFHIDLVFTIPLSLATPGPSWRLHPSQYYKLASPSPASHSALWLLAQINLMMSLKIEETLCWSFAVLTTLISLWDLDIEHSFTELQKLRSLHIEY